jgi:Zn-finger protein
VRGDYLVNDEQAEAKTFSGLSQGVSLKKRIEYYPKHFLGYRCTQVVHCPVAGASQDEAGNIRAWLQC